MYGEHSRIFPGSQCLPHPNRSSQGCPRLHHHNIPTPFLAPIRPPILRPWIDRSIVQRGFEERRTDRAMLSRTLLIRRWAVAAIWGQVGRVRRVPLSAEDNDCAEAWDRGSYDHDRSFSSDTVSMDAMMLGYGEQRKWEWSEVDSAYRNQIAHRPIASDLVG
jgi:hypothetical protein